MTPGTLLVSVGGDWRGAKPWVDAFRARLPDRRVATLEDCVEARPSGTSRPGSIRKAGSRGSIGLRRSSLGAGVDHLLSDAALPPDVPVARVVDPDLTARMSEYVLYHVLRQHRQMRRYERQQAESRWEDDDNQPVARDVRVGVMGLGVLGADAAAKLRLVGFDVAGWSRSPRSIDGLRCYAGADDLEPFLGRTDILVVLVPLTPLTAGMLDAALFGKLARDGRLGAPVLINAGRGGLQREADIIRALDDGTLGHAVLDVFEREPLARTSPLWRHPGVTLTPHNAAISALSTTADLISGQILAFERGEPLRHLVDRAKAY